MRWFTTAIERRRCGVPDVEVGEAGVVGAYAGG